MPTVVSNIEEDDPGNRSSLLSDLTKVVPAPASCSNRSGLRLAPECATGHQPSSRRRTTAPRPTGPRTPCPRTPKRTSRRNWGNSPVRQGRSVRRQRRGTRAVRSGIRVLNGQTGQIAAPMTDFPSGHRKEYLGNPLGLVPSRRGSLVVVPSAFSFDQSWDPYPFREISTPNSPAIVLTRSRCPSATPQCQLLKVLPECAVGVVVEPVRRLPRVRVLLEYRQQGDRARHERGRGLLSASGNGRLHHQAVQRSRSGRNRRTAGKALEWAIPVLPATTGGSPQSASSLAPPGRRSPCR